jgi:DnaJ family protein C protein 2
LALYTHCGRRSARDSLITFFVRVARVVETTDSEKKRGTSQGRTRSQHSLLAMAGVTVLPALPQNWAAPDSPAARSLAPVVQRTLIPAGSAYLAHVRRALQNLSFDAYDKLIEQDRLRIEALRADGLNGEDDLGVGDEEESPELSLLDPKEWKKQDHYQVLGLSHLRYKATPAQIKIAHRKKVLKHHPDKKAGQSHTTNDDAFFKCIQKAHEVLTNPERRRQFDSVDPRYLALEEDVPTAADFKGNKANDDDFFFKSWTPVYEMEARFSKKTPVPLLGLFDDPKAKVEAFYDFWYTFDSWRSFEYLDKEVNEGSDRLVVVSFPPLFLFPRVVARG